MAGKYANAKAQEILDSLPDFYFGTIRVNEKERQVGSDNWVLDVELTWLVTTTTGEKKNARISWGHWNTAIPKAKEIRERFNGRQGMVVVFGARNEPYTDKTSGEKVDKVVCDGMNFSYFDDARMNSIMTQAAEVADTPQATVPAPTAPLVGNRHNGDLATLAAQRSTTQATPPPVAARPVVPPVARPTVPTATARPMVPRPQVPQPPTR